MNGPGSNSYGNRLFMQLTLIPNVFAHEEFEISNISTGITGVYGRQGKNGFPGYTWEGITAITWRPGH